VTVAEALGRVRAALPPTVKPRPLDGPVAAYLEAHIEQGPELEAAGCQIGLVTGIQGRRRILVEVHGEDGHAGTLARQYRKDALSAAVAMIRALERLMHDPDDTVRSRWGAWSYRRTRRPSSRDMCSSRSTFVTLIGGR
jgi:beta-ureidopropionase / N-carbamoyl-L-amino-acid hydrolase